MVIELTSQGTADEDQGPKKELYRRLGVKEYFLFDPFAEYLPRPLVGYSLILGKYELLPPAADGGVLCSELGLRLVPNGTNLDLIDFATGRRVDSVLELPEVVSGLRGELLDLGRRSEAEADRLRKQADQERQRAEQAELTAAEARKVADEARKDAEEQRKRLAEAEKDAANERPRVQDLQREIERLRALLPPQPDSEQVTKPHQDLDDDPDT